jgi:hypothetical protein
MANSPAEQFISSMQRLEGAPARASVARTIEYIISDQIDRDHGHASDRRGHALRCQRIPATPEMVGLRLGQIPHLDRRAGQKVVNCLMAGGHRHCQPSSDLMIMRAKALMKLTLPPRSSTTRMLHR